MNSVFLDLLIFIEQMKMPFIDDGEHTCADGPEAGSDGWHLH